MASETKTIVVPQEGEATAEIKTVRGRALQRIVGGANPAKPIVAEVGDTAVVREDEAERLVRSGALEVDDKTLRALGIE